MYRFDVATLKLLTICAAGIFLNLTGFATAKYFELPVYLDTFGTIFISAS